jgi:hypothetical protein
VAVNEDERIDERMAKIQGVLPRRWDWPAVRAGAVVCLVFAVPITIVASLVDSSGLSALFFFGALFGFVVGSGCAAWVQRAGAPLSHALVTAAGTYLAAQAVFVALRLVTDGDVSWFRIVFTLNLVLAAGLVGGFLGNRLQAKGIEPSMNRGRP